MKMIMAIMNDNNADKIKIIIRYLAIMMISIIIIIAKYRICVCVYIFNVYVGANVYGCVPIFNL